MISRLFFFSITCFFCGFFHFPPLSSLYLSICFPAFALSVLSTALLMVKRVRKKCGCSVADCGQVTPLPKSVCSFSGVIA